MLPPTMMKRGGLPTKNLSVQQLERRVYGRVLTLGKDAYGRLIYAPAASA